MEIVLVFLAALFAVLVALAARVPVDVRQHDRIVGDLDDDLEAWVLDDDLRLKRELETIGNEFNEKGTFYSSFRLTAQARAKERALQAYRDQERRVQRQRVELRLSEGLLHGAWRFVTSQPMPRLGVPAKAKPVLDNWRAPVGHDGASASPVDPTNRRLPESDPS